MNKTMDLDYEIDDYQSGNVGLCMYIILTYVMINFQKQMLK